MATARILGVVFVGALLVGCSSSGRDRNNTGTGGGSSTTGGNGGTSNAGQGNTAGGAGGAGGSKPLICQDAPVTTGSDPNIDNFDSDTVGAAPAEFSNGDQITGGWFQYAEPGATVAFQIIAGGSTGNALEYAISAGDEYGGGLGFWVVCADVSAYTGLSVYVKGTPGQVIKLDFAVRGTTRIIDGGTCDAPADDFTTCAAPFYLITLTDTWTNVEIPWTAIQDGSSAGTPVPFVPSQFTGVGIYVGNDPYGTPDFAATVDVDEVRFMTGTSGAGGSGGNGGAGG